MANLVQTSRSHKLKGIGGTIGTALYVSIGRGVLNGGPGSLFIAFTIWSVSSPSVVVSSRLPHDGGEEASSTGITLPLPSSY